MTGQDACRWNAQSEPTATGYNGSYMFIIGCCGRNNRLPGTKTVANVDHG